MSLRGRTWLLIFALSGLLATTAWEGTKAADVSPPAQAAWTAAPPIDTWTFKVTPYVWAMSLNGSNTVKGRTTHVNASFIDILNHTQFPKGLFEVALFGEARYGRFGILADFLYTKMALGRSITRSRGVDALGASVGASAGLTVEMVIAELAASYEIARWASPGTMGGALDIYAGARGWWQRAEAHLDVSGTITTHDLTLTGDRTFSATGSVNWIDPVVGARLRQQVMRGLDVSVSGDVGGFGVGSKFSWQAIGALNYEFSRGKTVSWSGMLGYKALGVDYSKGSGLSHYEYDMVMHGPIFGVTARF